MNRRDKLILVIVGSLVGLGSLYLMANALVLGPAAELRERIAGHKKNLSNLDDTVKSGKSFSRRFDRILDRTHAGTFDAGGHITQRLVRERLRHLSLQSKLNENDLSLNRATGGSGPPAGRFREIGWTVSTRGSLKALTDFLYLVKAQPYLYRIENLTATPDLASSDVLLEFKYLTPYLLPDKKASKKSSAKTASSQPAETAIALDTPERKVYDGVAARDIFRPYMKKPVVVQRPPRPPSTPRPPRPKPPAPSTDPHFKIVGLPNWTGDPAKATVMVTDSRSKATVEHKIGAALGGGEIVAVDYRPLPMPGSEQILSPSRVVLKINSDYWTVELGQTLAQKRKADPKDLPGVTPAQVAVEKEDTEPVPVVKAPAIVASPTVQPTPAKELPVKAPVKAPTVEDLPVTAPATAPTTTAPAKTPAVQAAPATAPGAEQARSEARRRRAARLASLQMSFRDRTLALTAAPRSETNGVFER